MSNGKWGLLADIGLGVLASQGIPLDQIITRQKRRRRRPRGSVDTAALAADIYDVLKSHLRDDEREEPELVIVELARLIIEDRREEEVAEAPPWDADAEDLGADPRQRRAGRRRKATRKKVKR